MAMWAARSPATSIKAARPPFAARIFSSAAVTLRCCWVKSSVAFSGHSSGGGWRRRLFRCLRLDVLGHLEVRLQGGERLGRPLPKIGVLQVLRGFLELADVLLVIVHHVLRVFGVELGAAQLRE